MAGGRGSPGTATGKVAGTARFGELLKAARARRGLTQEELAERAGLSVRGVRYLELELRRPYKDTVERLVEALGLSEDDGRELLAAGRPGTAAAVVARSSVPAAPGPLIGREREVERIRELLARKEVRVVTLTGPGGVGKTRLAMEAAEQVQPRFSGGVVWVPLATVGESSLVSRAIGQALGVADVGAAQLAERLVSALRARAPTVLLLDNFEHVLQAAGIVAELVDGCPPLKVLVTSRTALSLRSEHELPVAPLKVPDARAAGSTLALAANASVDLFLRRAQAVKPDFALTEANADAVAAICRRLEGLPLALELAAARVRALSPKDMLGRLDHSLSFLTGGAQDLPVRQRTMRQTIAWSHGLLGDAEQMLLRRIAVFAGGCELGAVEEVCRIDGDPPLDVLEVVEALQRSSLVVLEDTPDEEVRFRMLETVREYALEKLADSGEEQTMRSRHVAWVLAFAEEGAPRFFGPGQGRWLDRLEQEHGNVRSALRWCIEQKEAGTGLRIAAAVWTLWYVRGHAEGRALVTALLTLPEAAAIGAPRAKSLLGAGQLANSQGDDSAARAHLQESIALHDAIGDRKGKSHALLAAGFAARVRQDWDEARTLLEEALGLSREIGERFITAASLHHLGMMAVDARGDHAEGRRLFEESLSAYRALGMQYFITVAAMSLGDVARAEGDQSLARARLREALELMLTGGEKPLIPSALDCFAHLAFDEGDMARAARLSGAASRLREVSGARSYPAATRARERWLATARETLGADAFGAAWEAGRAMTFEQAMGEALHED
jgi:predicted ATPase